MLIANEKQSANLRDVIPAPVLSTRFLIYTFSNPFCINSGLSGSITLTRGSNDPSVVLQTTVLLQSHSTMLFPFHICRQQYVLFMYLRMRMTTTTCRRREGEEEEGRKKEKKKTNIRHRDCIIPYALDERKREGVSFEKRISPWLLYRV